MAEPDLLPHWVAGCDQSSCAEPAIAVSISRGYPRSLAQVTTQDSARWIASKPPPSEIGRGESISHKVDRPRSQAFAPGSVHYNERVGSATLGRGYDGPPGRSRGRPLADLSTSFRYIISSVSGGTRRGGRCSQRVGRPPLFPPGAGHEATGYDLPGLRQPPGIGARPTPFPWWRVA